MRDREAQAIRLILAGKENGFSNEIIQERLVNYMSKIAGNRRNRRQRYSTRCTLGMQVASCDSPEKAYGCT